VLLALITVAACAPAAGTETSGSEGRPVAGGTLRMSISAEPGCLDAHAISATQQALLGRILYDTVTTLDPDGNVAPYLAESWQISEDGKRYTVLLRRGETFFDGAPWNAYALMINFEHLTGHIAFSQRAVAFTTHQLA